MDIRYDIGKLMQLAFGINSPIYMVNPISIGAAEPVNVSYQNVKLIEVEEAKKLSHLGTPIVFPMTFKGGIYKIYDTNAKLIETEFSDFEIPAATLVDFRRAKNIVRTNVSGNNGTIKEIYGFDDWVISMRGIMLPEPGRTEKEQKETLLKFEQIAGSIEVVGELFLEKNIYALAIEELTLNSIQAKPQVLPFEINALSDEAIELIIEEKQNGRIESGDVEVITFYE